MVNKVTYWIKPSTAEVVNLSISSLGPIRIREVNPFDYYFLSEIDLDILGFFARNGPNPRLAMTKGPIKPKRRGKRALGDSKRNEEQALPYDYKRLSRYAEKLEKKGLLQRIRPKTKEVFALTFEGFHVHMRYPEGKHENIEDIIRSNRGLLPFSQFWNEIIEIVGKDFVLECLDNAIAESIFKDIVKIETLDMNLDFFSVRKPPVFTVRDDQKARKIQNLLSETVTLRKSYVIFLASNDINSLIEKHTLPETTNDLINLESEKALVFFEKRSIHEKSLFIPGTRLKELLKDYNSLRFFFTGMLMDKLLSYES